MELRHQRQHPCMDLLFPHGQDTACCGRWRASDRVRVDSGLPQGTVLGPVLFLAFINDLPSAVNTYVHLFADNCILYHPIKSQEECSLLQQDLANVEKWENKWCMSFNAVKCNAITITRKRQKIVKDYKLHNQTLERVSSATYLGVELSSDLTWSTHINKTCSKANKHLAFICRNLKINNRTIKETAYK